MVVGYTDTSLEFDLQYLSFILRKNIFTHFHSGLTFVKVARKLIFAGKNDQHYEDILLVSLECH